MDVVQHFPVTYLRLLFEGLRVTLVFCLNPGKLGQDIVNVFGAITCLIFEKCIFNFIRLFVFVLKKKLSLNGPIEKINIFFFYIQE